MGGAIPAIPRKAATYNAATMRRRRTKLVIAADTAGIVSALMLLVSLALGSAQPKAPPGHRQAE